MEDHKSNLKHFFIITDVWKLRQNGFNFKKIIVIIPWKLSEKFCHVKTNCWHKKVFIQLVPLTLKMDRNHEALSSESEVIRFPEWCWDQRHSEAYFRAMVWLSLCFSWFFRWKFKKAKLYWSLRWNGSVKSFFDFWNRQKYFEKKSNLNVLNSKTHDQLNYQITI